MKKSLCIALVLALLCAMIPMTGLAGGGLGLFVSGFDIVGTMADVLGDGTVSFDAATSTLTLKNANLVASGSDMSAISVAASSSLTKLNLVLSGSNTISLNANGGSEDRCGILVNKGIDLAVTGSGSLTITDKGTAKVAMASDPTQMPVAFFMAAMDAGNLTIGEEDGSAPSISITCDSIAPFVSLGKSVTNYGMLNISVPTAGGFSQTFVGYGLTNYGTIKVNCDAVRADIGTTLMMADGINEGTIELTASTGNGMMLGLMATEKFVNNGTLKVKIGGDTLIEGDSVGLMCYDSFTNAGSCQVEMNNLSGVITAGIEAIRGVENTGKINIKLTDAGSDDDDDNQVTGVLTTAPLNNKDGTINIEIGDSIAPRVYGIDAAASTNTTITNTGKITVKLGNAPNGTERAIHTEADFKNLGSQATVDITVGHSADKLSTMSAFGLSAAVLNEKQVLTNEGTINVNIYEEMPGTAIVVTDKLINTKTGKINARAKEYGIYLDTGLLQNEGVIHVYASSNGSGMLAYDVTPNTGLIYATGGLRALNTRENGLEGSGSLVMNDDIANLGEIRHDPPTSRYYLKGTETEIKTFYSATPLMAYKQAAIAELEEAMETEGYVSENAQQALEYWIEEILNAADTDEVDQALAKGLQSMKDSEEEYLKAKEKAKNTLEDALNEVISDEAKQILQDALDELETLLNSAAFSDLITPVLEDAEAADLALKAAQDTAIAELEDLGKTTYTSDEAQAAMKDAIEAVKAATNLPDVATALEEGKKAMADADVLKKAIEEAVAELEELGKTTYTSDEAQAAMKTAIEAVKAATSLQDVATALEEGKKAMADADALKKAIEEAVAELEELGKTTYTSDEAQAAMKTAIEAVKAATNLQDVATALENGKKAMANAGVLQKAIAEAVAELEAAKTKAVSDKAKAALDEAIQKVKAATSEDEITAAKEAGLKAAEEADKALADAIKAALAELDEAKTTASDEAKKQIDTAKEKIAAATSVKQVEELLADLYAAIFDIRYVLLEGNGLGWVKDSEVSARFRSSAPYAKFDSVEIDGDKVSTADYTSSEGSTIILLKPSLLKKLSVGKHTIVIRSKDGLAKGYFNVKPALPPTGDNANPFLWTALLMLSLGLALAAGKMKRREQ